MGDSNRQRLLRSGFAALLLALMPGAAPAQARDTAHQNLHLEVFGMGTYYRPNYVNTPKNGYGFTGGMSVDWRIRPVRLGGEVRGDFTNYAYMSQRVLGVGPRATLDFGRWHPYGNFLFGYGIANFHQYSGNYRDNDSTVYSYGGGVDIGVSRFWAARLDYERQKWDFDSPSTPFQPDAFSVGVRYSIHTPSRTGPRW